MPTPVFELHILPMMRASDREHMLSAFDLWDYDAVVTHADDIARRAAVDMPTAATGGPWPEEWVALFERWRATGFKRLALGSGAYALAAVNDRMVLTATGTRPSAQHKVWLQLDGESADRRTYVLYVLAPDAPPGGAAVSFSTRERYPISDTRRVFVRDAAGTQEVLAVAPTPEHVSFAAATDRAFFALDDD
jgi:hypothetical protein